MIHTKRTVMQLEDYMNILNSEEKTALLRIARQALDSAVKREKLRPIEIENLPITLKEFGSSFVTLTIHGELRGCIGSLEPTMPLAEDVREHAAAAALDDYRFPPVQPSELPDINIEISYLSIPKPLSYDNPDQLLTSIKPGVDGVVIKDGFHRATFLPQVWEKLSDPEEFLSHLCLKMGASPNLWRLKQLDVEIYQVEEFHE
jgi:uncharacterized protein